MEQWLRLLRTEEGEVREKKQKNSWEFYNFPWKISNVFDERSLTMISMDFLVHSFYDYMNEKDITN